jgi:ribA/ribD-fused uncharacterized protein
LIVHGIHEIPGENVHLIIQSFMEHDLCIANAKNIRIVRAHRIGTVKTRGAVRPIIILFYFYGDRESVWKTKSKLKVKPIWISEDFPQHIISRRQKLTPFLKAAWSAGKRASLRSDKLFIEDKSYTVETINQIPKSIDPATTCEKVTENVILFFGRYSPFSNFYYAPFDVDGITFHSVEQYTQFSKAKLMNDDVTAQTILKQIDPADQKALGRRVSNFDRDLWDQHARRIVKEGCDKKFNAHPNLRSILKQSGERRLAEASPTDVYFGIGLSLRDSLAVSEVNWVGKNELGKILMEIRAELPA